MQQIHVSKHPLVSCCYSNVTFEEGVKPIQERVQAVKQDPNYCSFTLNKWYSESCHFEQGPSLPFVTSQMILIPLGWIQQEEEDGPGLILLHQTPNQSPRRTLATAGVMVTISHVRRHCHT